MRIWQLLLVFSLTIIANATSASPGYSFVCFDRQISATIEFDLEWQTAFVNFDGEQIELPATNTQSGPEGYFDFDDGSYSFTGVAPEGRITLGDRLVARCHQTRASIKNIALYGSENTGNWSKYEAPGEGFQTVRSTPSVFGEKLASLNQGEPVLIRENTDQFLDGFFWFKIEYGEGEQGYMWGALLCTDAEDPELAITLRRCNPG